MPRTSQLRAPSRDGCGCLSSDAGVGSQLESCPSDRWNVVTSPLELHPVTPAASRKWEKNREKNQNFQVGIKISGRSQSHQAGISTNVQNPGLKSLLLPGHPWDLHQSELCPLGILWTKAWSAWKRGNGFPLPG